MLSKTVKASYLRRSFQLMGIFFTPKSLYLIFIFFWYVDRISCMLAGSHPIFPFFPHWFTCVIELISRFLKVLIRWFTSLWRKSTFAVVLLVGFWFSGSWAWTQNLCTPGNLQTALHIPQLYVRVIHIIFYRLLCRLYILLSTSMSPLSIFILYLVIHSCSFFKWACWSA